LKTKTEIKNGYNYLENENSIIISFNYSPIIKNSKLFRLEENRLSNKSIVILDLKDIIEYDSYLIVIISIFRNLAVKYNFELQIINENNELSNFINILDIKEYKNIQEKKVFWLKRHIIEVGENITNILLDLRNFIEFFGIIIIKFLALPFRFKKVRWSDLPDIFTKNGVMAVPITVLIVFLIGLISGYQGALQLKQFGADIFIADLVGISITRELSPLMVAILVAGRSGSSFAAQIGTMKVSEEIDALTTLGFDKYDYLVLPRVLAITFAMPILVLICNLVGVIGGLVAAITTLEITLSGYINQLQAALSLGDIFSGLIKSIIFGFLISLVGCYKGLSASGGAESVGKITTGSVVISVFLIIFVDALFTFLLSALGI